MTEKVNRFYHQYKYTFPISFLETKKKLDLLIVKFNINNLRLLVLVMCAKKGVRNLARVILFIMMMIIIFCENSILQILV